MHIFPWVFVESDPCYLIFGCVYFYPLKVIMWYLWIVWLWNTGHFFKNGGSFFQNIAEKIISDEYPIISVLNEENYVYLSLKAYFCSIFSSLRDNCSKQLQEKHNIYNLVMHLCETHHGVQQNSGEMLCPKCFFLDPDYIKGKMLILTYVMEYTVTRCNLSYIICEASFLSI